MTHHRRPAHSRAKRTWAGVTALSCLVAVGAAVNATAAAAPSDQDSAPADALGTPASSTVARADDLLVGDYSKQRNLANWASLKPDLSGTTAQANPAYVAVRPSKNPDYATTAGRFLDPEHDTVLDLRQGWADGRVIWTLGSSSDVAESGWRNTTRSAGLVAGDTDFLSIDGAEKEPLFSMATADTGAGIGATASARTGTAPRLDQQWSVIADPNHAGWSWLADRSDGLCLDALNGSDQPGSPVGTWPCQDRGEDNQLWKVLADGTILNGKTNLALAADSTLQKLVQAIPGSTGYKWWTVHTLSQPQQRPRTWSAVTGTDPAAPFAVTSGDLDRAVDDAGQYHDEAAVAYADGDHRLQVRVVDYNATAGHLLATAPAAQLPVLGALRNGKWFPGSVGIAAGDFDGDGFNELAVTWQDAAGLHATFLRYTADGSNRALTVLKSDVLLVSTKAQPGLSLIAGLGDTKAGDFDGSGRDSLAVAYARVVGDYTEADVRVDRFNRDLAPVAGATSDSDGSGHPRVLLAPTSSDTTWTPRGIRLAPGLFRLDDGDYTLSRRELAVAWTGLTSPTVALNAVEVLDVASTGPTALTINAQGKALGLGGVDPQLARQYPLSIAAGGYRGLTGDQEPPLWGIAVASADSTFAAANATRQGRVQMVSLTATGLASAWEQVYNGDDVPHVTAYDRSGSSLELGAPAVFTVTNLARTDVAAAQPPAHADWLDGKFVNVSRNPDFAVELGSDNETKLSSSNTTTSSTAKGVSENFKSENTVKHGLFGVEEYGGSLNVDQSIKAEWKGEEKNLQSYSTTTTTSIASTGTDDDIVDGALQTITIYRYPILNGPLKTADGKNLTTPGCTQVCYGYWEIEVPGATIPVHGYGRSYDWYQPTWQNGNALSYPKLVGGQVAIPDLGSYSYRDDNGNTIVKTTPLFNVVNDVGGGKTTDKLSIATSEGAGFERTSERKMTNKVDATLGITAKVAIGIGTVKTKDSVTVGYDQTDSWSQLQTGESETTSAKNFTLDVPQIAEDQAYRVGTAYYYDSAGAQHVIHGVDLTASAQGGQWWKQTYGQQADPALNLPFATVMTKNSRGVYDDPAWSSLPNRQQIRGFTAVDPATQVPLEQSPQPGDKVAFQVQVHNFSLKAATNVPVRFYAVPVDSLGLNPTGAPVPIGAARNVGAISPQGIVTVTSPVWTAPGNSGTDIQNYRIFVVLNQDGTQPEIHPLDGPVCPDESTRDGKPLIDPMTGKDEELACGQNNQGYGTIAVMPARQLQAPGGTPHVSLTAATLLGSTSVGLGRTSSPAATPAAPVRAGVPVLGLARAAANGDSRDISQVLVFDGNPAKGNLVASTTIAGVTPGAGGSGLFTWTPTKAGRHCLHTLLLGVEAGHAVAGPTLRVNVKRSRR